MTADNLRQLIESYLHRYPEERSGLASLLKQLEKPDSPTSRKTFPGHITASAIVLSPDLKQVLLIYHRVFDGWYQPGGHCEASDANVLVTAQREAEEETAVIIAKQMIIDDKLPLLPLRIDTHPVPARPDKDEPAHFHHDFQYVFVAASIELTHQIAEVTAAQWFSLDAPETQHIRKSVDRMRAINFIPTPFPLQYQA